MAIKKSELYSSIWESCDKLRGGIEPSEYKNYVLVILFVKYVSDRYGNNPYAPIVVPAGGSFKDMVAWKNKPEIGDNINKIIGRLAEENELRGIIDTTDFNDTTKLGKGKDMIDRLTSLISIFENPALDFSKNRAEGDDLLGDAYEYLMKNFAVESGKSKGQFYTPAEVSRIMSKVIGISKAEKASKTVYDPTCGSGSLLIKAADETDIGVTLYGQEIDISMAALAKMNMILHHYPSAKIWSDNTLTTPHFVEEEGSLKTFDFAVANPPFSDKNWRNGLDPGNDYFRRFDGYGTPPNKNGDYAYVLHLLKSLKIKGKGAIILPHGVLFRGNIEAEIRKNIIKRGYIKGIIGLPANLFYGTGILACIIVIDKEDAHKRSEIFMIDASKGFVKDGNKNRLREQDIQKIVDVFNNRTELPKYSQRVSYEEIEKNDYNLNIPRYIDNSEAEEIQDIEAHLKGGIPGREIDALADYWPVFPTLREELFSAFRQTDIKEYEQAALDTGDEEEFAEVSESRITEYNRKDYYKLNIEVTDLRNKVLEHPEYKAFKKEVLASFKEWKDDTVLHLKGMKTNDKAKTIIHTISEGLLRKFTALSLIDKYDIYQVLMEYWKGTMQDDVHLIVVNGWIADKDIIGEDLLIRRWFSKEQEEIDLKKEKQEQAFGEMQELDEENSGDDDLFSDARTDKGKITKQLVKSRLKVIEKDPENEEEYSLLEKYMNLLEKETRIKKSVKDLEKELSKKVQLRYGTLTENEIKMLIVDDKWMLKIEEEIETALDMIAHRLISRIKELAERYEQTLPEIENEVREQTKKVEEHLQKMGFQWK